jgi:simple sugar transport system ATP-binding protein
MSLELRGITKQFGSLIANDDINFKVEAGEIHAILGENGAGKSTLMNIVYGLLSPDKGQILVDGQEIKIKSPLDALAAGIGMVHQHFMLIPVFTVAENIVLGHEKTNRAGLLDLATARQEIIRVSKEFNFEVDPDALIEDLPVGIQQRVEIIRALIYNSKILILDEPTAVLTPQETDELLANMKKLRDSGRSIVFITHKLREVKAVADRISIIRRGKVVGTVQPTASQEEMASLMVGRPVDLTINKANIKPGKKILEIVDLTVAAGEVVAVAGVQGNGQSELAEAIVGLRDQLIGSIKLSGIELIGRSVDECLKSGIAYVPESRELDGLISSFSITENLILDTHSEAPYSKGIFYKPAMAQQVALERIKEFDIRAQSASDPASSLSGGNKQKVVLARELSRPVDLVVVCQPTRGLDVGSIEFVHQRLISERDSGRAVLLFSTELDEVFALADRIAIMYRGEIIAILPASASREEVGLYMAGINPAKAKGGAA